MEKNLVLLKETMEHILKHPETHHQGTWVDPCKSTMCFAGHAAMLAGATFNPKIYLEEDEWLVDEETGKHVQWDAGRSRVYVNDFAAEKLGLNDWEEAYLFNAARTKEELIKAVEKFQEGYSVRRKDYEMEFYKEEN